VRVGVSNVKVCFTLGPTIEAVEIDGASPSPRESATFEDGRPVGGKMRVEYLRPGRRSWLSSASSVARRVGLGRWAPGTWIVLLVICAMAVVTVGTSWLILRELR
jgi:hypothetical protein